MKRKKKLILKGISNDNAMPFKSEIYSLNEVRESGLYTLVGYNVTEKEGLPPAEYDESQYNYIEALLFVTRNGVPCGDIEKETIGQTITISNREDGGTNIYNRSWCKEMYGEEWTPWLMMVRGDIMVVEPANDTNEKISILANDLSIEVKRAEDAENSIAETVKENKKTLQDCINEESSRVTQVEINLRNYATARFHRIEVNETIVNKGDIGDIPVAIVYYVPGNIFIAEANNGEYYDTWNGMDAYMRGGAIRKDKVYLCGSNTYTWENFLVPNSVSYTNNKAVNNIIKELYIKEDLLSGFDFNATVDIQFSKLLGTNLYTGINIYQNGKIIFDLMFAYDTESDAELAMNKILTKNGKYAIVNWNNVDNAINGYIIKNVLLYNNIGNLNFSPSIKQELENKFATIEEVGIVKSQITPYPFTDNLELNKYIKELYIDISKLSDFDLTQPINFNILKANAWGGSYFTGINLTQGASTLNGTKTLNKEEDALNAAKNIFSVGKFHAVINWDNIDFSNKTFSAKLNPFVADISFSPSIKQELETRFATVEEINTIKPYLSGLRFCALGDSITDGVGNKSVSWYDMLLERYGNKAESLNFAETGQCLRTMADLCTPENMSNIDICFVMGGTNVLSGYNIGTIDDIATPDRWKPNTTYTVGDRVLGGTQEEHGWTTHIMAYLYWYECVSGGTSGNTTDATGFDTTTGSTFTDGTVTWRCLGHPSWYSDMKGICRKVWECNPKTLIVWIVPIKQKSDIGKAEGQWKNSSKFQAIRDFCARYSIKMIDMQKEFPLNEWTKDAIMYDDLHPNENGYKIMLEIVNAYI